MTPPKYKRNPLCYDLSYAYNRLGRQIEITDAQGTRTFDYNNELRLESETIPGFADLNLNYIYEDGTAGTVNGRPSGFTLGTTADPASRYQTGWDYDSAGRLESVTGPGLPEGGAHYSYKADTFALLDAMEQPKGSVQFFMFFRFPSRLPTSSATNAPPLRHGICCRSLRLPQSTCRAVPSFAGGYGGQAAPAGCNRPILRQGYGWQAPLPSPPPPDTPLGSGGLLPAHKGTAEGVSPIFHVFPISPTSSNLIGNQLQPLRHGIRYRSPRLPFRTCRAVARRGSNRPPLPSPPPPDPPLGSGGLLPAHN